MESGGLGRWEMCGEVVDGVWVGVEESCGLGRGWEGVEERVVLVVVGGEERRFVRFLYMDDVWF